MCLVTDSQDIPCQTNKNRCGEAYHPVKTWANQPTASFKIVLNWYVLVIEYEHLSPTGLLTPRKPAFPKILKILWAGNVPSASH